MPQAYTNSQLADVSSSVFMTKDKHSLWTVTREPDGNILLPSIETTLGIIFAGLMIV